MVEDPLSAKADGMPESIIDHDHPSAVLRPSELAKRLVAQCQNDALNPSLDSYYIEIE